MQAGEAVRPLVLGTGDVFAGRYEVKKCLKTGGMGAVYEVIDRATKRRRALKILLPTVVGDPEIRARFTLEAIVVADVTSEHLVEIFDAGIDAATDAPFLVMELLQGEDLSALLGRRGRLPPDEVLELLQQAARALDKTAAAGVVHRDIKPGNLFRTERDDGSPRLRILDFGIAKIVFEGTSTAPNTVPFGTPLYMAPEQIRGDGDIDPRADLYSLAHVAYSLLVGKPYFREEARGAHLVALQLKIERGLPEAASARAAREGVTLPPAFDDWLAKAAAARPEDRFATGAAMIDALTVALGITRKAGEPNDPGKSGDLSGDKPAISTTPSLASRTHSESTTRNPTTSTLPPAPGRSRMAMGGVVAFGLLLGVAAALAWAPWRHDAPPPIPTPDSSGKAATETGEAPSTPGVEPSVRASAAAPPTSTSATSATASTTTATSITSSSPTTASTSQSGSLHKGTPPPMPALHQSASPTSSPSIPTIPTWVRTDPQ